MWFGTISGLNRFDGHNMVVFRNDPQDTTSLLTEDINKLFEDPDGKIWISTWNGIDVYDPLTERFRINPTIIAQKYGLPNGNLTDIVKDQNGNYWFVHQDAGLFFYDKQRNTTRNLNYVNDNLYTIASNQVATFCNGQNNDGWIVHRNGIIERINLNTLRIESRDSSLFKLNKGEFPYACIADKDNDLWIYVTDSNKGLLHFNTSTRKITSYNTSTSSTLHIGSDIIRGVVQDADEDIWIATDHGGINVLDKDAKFIRYLVNSKYDDYSIAQNSINVLYKDDQGIIWAGTYKRGISYFNKDKFRFPLYTHDESDSNSLPFEDINAFAEDGHGNIWIGTNGGGLIYLDRKTNTYRQYLHDPKNPNSLSANIIVSLYYDKQNVLWIGTYFGGLNSFDGNKFTRYPSDSRNTATVSDNNIWDIFEDSDGNLYVGTLTQGLDVFDKNRRKIAHYSRDIPNTTFHANYITAFDEDPDGRIWIGTGYGIYILDRKKKSFTHYLSQPDKPQGLTSNNIFAFFHDDRDNVWVGTSRGLNLFNKDNGFVRSFTTDDGLPHNTVLTILKGDNNDLWLGTAAGLCNLKLQWKGDSLSYDIFNYDQHDGLQGKQFNENAALRTRKGELIFGGPNGFNVFNPKDIPINKVVPRVAITGLEIMNKPVRTGTSIDNRVILQRSISFTDEIELNHTDNVFSIEFALLSYNHPEKSRYRYMLEGFDENWITVSSDNRKVTYTNLNAGTYLFKVIASNNDGVWNNEAATLGIIIHPPWWKSGYAIALYVALVILGLFLTRRLIQQRERMKFAIEQERQEAQRMHDLDMMKLKFFTNVSHEFRTPLTLILTPVEHILKHPDDPVPPTQFQLIYRNAKRLLNLVNQLLDFRKLEVQEVRFNPSEGDIIAFIRETVLSFSDLSEKKGINLRLSNSIEHLEAIFDQDKLERILFNLLSNAFKFTPEGGEVSVEVMSSDENLIIHVADTGIGIPSKNIDRIFDRFFQQDLPKSMVNPGSGIGLSITREFVRAHHGTIDVQSEVGKGTRFTVTLPLQTVSRSMHQSSEEEIIPVPVGGLRASILLIEDNEDFRFYLKDNLRMQYDLHEAENGVDGWRKITSLMPDLVVMDVMMPEPNGLELCRRIKRDEKLRHIPVILLTARTSQEQKMEGFEAGADDYVTKPFNFEILQSRIRNLLQQRDIRSQDGKPRIHVRAADIEVTSLDEKLIQKALQIVESRLSDADFSVEEMAREMGMSRVHLYKKLHSLTGESPIEFIRNIRLQRAAQLLEKSQLTVSEIAYKVGFNNPKYFARYFREKYQVLPSVFASGKRSK